MVLSKNTLLIATLKKMDRLGKMVAFTVLINFMILVSVFLVISCRELTRLIFLEAVFGLTHILTGVYFYLLLIFVATGPSFR
jgi:hypothetical protein